MKSEGVYVKRCICECLCGERVGIYYVSVFNVTCACEGEHEG